MNNKEKIIEEFLKIGKDSRERIDEIPCSKCGEEEAYLYKENPGLVFCPRGNHCGDMTRLSDYFPDLVSNRELSPEEEEKSLLDQAKHYALVSRGMYNYEDCGGEYCTLTVDGKKYAALRARLEDGETFNYRVIGHPTKKAHFDYGKPVGNLMFIPKQSFSYKRIWIAESPLKAMALVAAGKDAIGMTSTSTNIMKSEFVKKALEINPCCVFVLALDNDEAGKKTTKKWYDKYIEKEEDFGMALEVAFPPSIGVDWDDYLKAGNLDKMIERGKTLGEIYQCDDISEVKKLYAKKVVKEDLPRDQRTPEWWPRLVEFQGATWYISHKEKKEVVTYTSTLVLDGQFRSGYNATTGDELNRETTTIAKVINKAGKVYNVKLTADDRVNPSSLRKKLSDVALLQYNPVYGTHDYIVKTLMRVNKTATVRHVERAGYDKESGCYVFPTFCVDKSGKLIKPNKLGFFPGVELHMAKDLIPKAFEPDFKGNFSHSKFLKLVHQGWGNNGVILMSYYISCYFSHLKCSGIDGTFPFISFEGAPGTGKSTLISLLNMAFNFFSSEGRPVNKTDTKKGLGRDLAKYSSLCLPLLENRKEKEGKELLSEDMFLNLYGRNPSQTTAIKSMNLETRSIPFDAGLTMVWNHNTFITKEVRDRFINLKVKVESGKPLFNKKNQEAKDELKSSGTSVSSIGLDVLRKRNYFERTYLNKIAIYKESLAEEGLKDERYKDNFAHLYASIDIYQDSFLRQGNEEEIRESDHIINSCMIELTEKAKNQSVETLGDAGIVKEFWEAFQQRLNGACSSSFDDRVKKGEHFVFDKNILYIRPKKVFDLLRWDKQEIDSLKIALQRSHLFRGTKSKRSNEWNLPEEQSPVCHTWAFEPSFPSSLIHKSESY